MKTNFDVYLAEQLKDPLFAGRFARTGDGGRGFQSAESSFGLARSKREAAPAITANIRARLEFRSLASGTGLGESLIVTPFTFFSMAISHTPGGNGFGVGSFTTDLRTEWAR